MQQKWSHATEVEIEELSSKYFYSETIEVNRLSALAFFAAGDGYKGKRFFWQNREKTMTLVGLGHAFVIENNKEERFTDVDRTWRKLVQYISKDYDVQPILFGGFTFDASNQLEDEWQKFPHNFFVLASFQLVMRHDKAYVTVHYIGDTPDEQKIAQLRKERDYLIHAAQVKEVRTYDKPVVVQFEERYKERYLKTIEEVTRLIQQGHAEKVVIARSVALQFNQKLSSPQVLSHVANEQPESYLFGLEYDDLLFFGASPERLVKVNEKRAYSSCVAGSIRRGKTADEDETLGQQLLNDEKNLAEHQYVVEMIANTFQRNCVEMVVPEGPRLLKIRDIQHLFTPVEGKLHEKTSILQLVQSLHPTPALGGVPRNAAMEMIRSFEPTSRGLYAAPIGWMDANGDGEFAVAIRSAMLRGDRAYLYAGGGIVANSVPQSEYEETQVKLRPMLRALGGEIVE